MTLATRLRLVVSVVVVSLVSFGWAQQPPEAGQRCQRQTGAGPLSGELPTSIGVYPPRPVGCVLGAHASATIRVPAVLLVGFACVIAIL
jgi:hypothetical protein